MHLTFSLSDEAGGWDPASRYVNTNLADQITKIWKEEKDLKRSRKLEGNNIILIAMEDGAIN